MEKIELTWECIQSRARLVASEIAKAHRYYTRKMKIYGVPNGGLLPASLVCENIQEARLVEDPSDADIIIDDIIDSGATRNRYSSHFFYALVDKQGADKGWAGKWVSFPWERMKKEEGPEDNIRRILQYIGEDPEREGLLETPARVVKSYGEIFSGYKIDPQSVFKTFHEPNADEMVILKDTEMISMCEHHMLPFVGKAHVAYIPKDGKVIGISKLARIVDIYAKRLQIQERLTDQISNCLMTLLDPLGAACVIEAQHLCMCARGVGKQNSRMVTSSLYGVFRESEVRSEFFSAIRGKA
jgi:GTP cyclohydrolase IA